MGEDGIFCRVSMVLSDKDGRGRRLEEGEGPSTYAPLSSPYKSDPLRLFTGVKFCECFLNTVLPPAPHDSCVSFDALVSLWMVSVVS